MLPLTIAICLHSFFISFAFGLRNTTIDDTNGDNSTIFPSYNPRWNDPSCGQSCAIRPDATQMMQGTWREITYQPEMPSATFEFDFRGSEIYVYFVLSDKKQAGLVTETKCNFTIDGNLIDTFFHAPSGQGDLMYNQLVFSRKNLSPNATHKLKAGVTDRQDAQYWLAFDYAVVAGDDSTSFATTPQGSNSGPKKGAASNHATAIAAGVVGGVVGLALVLGLAIFLRRRKRQKISGSDGFTQRSDKTTPLASNGSLPGQIHPYPRSNPSSDTLFISRSVSSLSAPSLLNVPPMGHAQPYPPPYMAQPDQSSLYSSDGTSYDLQHATEQSFTRPTSFASTSRTSISATTYVSTYPLQQEMRQKDLEHQVMELRRQLEERNRRDMNDHTERAQLRFQVDELQRKIQDIQRIEPLPPMPVAQRTIALRPNPPRF